MANAEIVAIGSELLLGQIVDTNSAWMAQRLTALGVNLYFKSVVGDNPGRMKEVIQRALERADIVITSGGLGPTQDDLTREIVAEVTGRKLVFDDTLLDWVESNFKRRGRSMTPNNRRQAYMPEGATRVDNPNGTAPCFIVEDPRGVVYSLPGVPVEMKWLFEHEVEPYLRRKFNLAEVIHYRVLKIVGIGVYIWNAQESERLVADLKRVRPDVIVVHRLLKNHARDIVGNRPYALLSDAALAALDVPTTGMTAAVETYDDLPPVPVHVLPLA